MFSGGLLFKDGKILVASFLVPVLTWRGYLHHLQCLPWLIESTNKQKQNNAPNPEKQCSYMLSRSSENRAFKSYNVKVC